MDAPACTIELKWIGDGEPQQLSHQVNIIGAKEPADFFHIRYSPPAVGELLYICTDMILIVTCACSHQYSIYQYST